VTKSLSH